MALHHELPIYRETYELLQKVTPLVRNMPRDIKRQVGGKLLDECTEIMVLIFRANVASHKVPHIQDLLERLQVVELMLRMAKDMRWISVNQFSAAVPLTQSIGRQATGWKRHATRSPAV